LQEEIMESKKNPTGTPTTTGGTFNPSSPTEGNTPRSTQTASDIGGNNPTETRPGKEGGGNVRSFNCRDVGFKECPWETSGTEQEMMPQIEQHGREKHGINSFDENTRNNIRGAMRDRAA
jgi:predicted small metal-binding protein